MLCRSYSQDAPQGTYRPIKIVYYPRDPFFVIIKQQKTRVIFPMRFRESSDVAIAISFFQELVDVGSSEAMAKAPPCTWSPIPPPELRGELIEDLSTNGGFVSFDILSHHISNKRVDKTTWNLLNFNAYVKLYVKCTRGFIQRGMRKRSEHLAEVLHETSLERDESYDQIEKKPGSRWTRDLIRFSRLKKFRGKSFYTCWLSSSNIERDNGHLPDTAYTLKGSPQQWNSDIGIVEKSEAELNKLHTIGPPIRFSQVC
ncbi:hypothetical protein Dimus_028548 [Dionaea muscipula]